MSPLASDIRFNGLRNALLSAYSEDLHSPEAREFTPEDRLLYATAAACSNVWRWFGWMPEMDEMREAIDDLLIAQ